MIETDETALMCDLAETYQIFDFKQLPAYLVAAFSVGLKNDSRIKMALSGQRITLSETLLAGIVDRLSVLIWQQTKDGQKGKNRPGSLVEQLTKDPKVKEEVSFSSSEEFERMRNELLAKIGGEA